MDIGRAITDYIVWHEVNRHSPKTVAWYRWNLGAFARWLHATGRSTQIAEITVADARAFLHAETQRDVKCPDHPTGVERAGKLFDRTLHCYARAIRAFFRWLVDELRSIRTLIRRGSTAARTQTRARVLDLLQVGDDEQASVAATDYAFHAGGRSRSTVQAVGRTACNCASSCPQFSWRTAA